MLQTQVTNPEVATFQSFSKGVYGMNRSIIQCRCGVGLSSEREGDQDDQDDVSNPHQVNDRMLGRLGNVGRCVLEFPE